MGRARTAVKYFVYGLAIGLLFAPGSGEETRGRLVRWLKDEASGIVRNSLGGS